MRIALPFLSLLVFVGCNNDAVGTQHPDLSVKVVRDMAMNGDANASGNACDVVTQDCTAAGMNKCSLVDTGTAMMPNIIPECVAGGGTVGDQMPCMRSAIGMDNCTNGLICTGFGSSSTARRCTKLCHTDTDCGTGSKCASFSQVDPTDGVCVKGCDLFSNTCGASYACGGIFFDTDSTMQMQDIIIGCRGFGTGGPGTACMSDEDCTAATFCDNAGTCSAFCDDTHMCPKSNADGGAADAGALMCMPLGNLANNGGICG